MPSHQTGLFGTYKQCEICHRPLPNAYTESLCPACMEQELFHRVKDFIRENDVNEYEVAEHFKIPLRQVKEWIREGRIEYKKSGEPTISSTRCHHCGVPVSFGTLCPKCLKLINHSQVQGFAMNNKSSDNSKMRFLDKDSE